MNKTMCRALKVKKTARRDLAYVTANKLDGATTVSSTMFLASLAGIHIFVTGGATYIICFSPVDWGPYAANLSQSLKDAFTR